MSRNIRVEIDLNVRTARNETYASFDDCSLVPMVGEAVTVFESESGAEGPGVANVVDHKRRLVYIAVPWRELRITTELKPGPYRTAPAPAGSPRPEAK